MYKSVVLISLLLAVSLAQVCPFCEEGSCSYVMNNDMYNTGFATCSKCAIGALYSFALNIDPYSAVASGWNANVSICQPCSAGCKTCHFGVTADTEGTQYHANICDECDSGYVISPSDGACTALPANCANGTWTTPTTLTCQSCQSGYTLSYGQCVYTGSTY